MRSLDLLGSALMLFGLAGAGCSSSWRYSEKMLSAPGERASATDTATVSVQQANSAHFIGVPIQVQNAFETEYGNAAVTRVSMIPSGTGEMYYQVVYIADGHSGEAVYFADGRSAAPSSGTIVTEEASLGPITPRPTTHPTTAPSEYQ